MSAPIDESVVTLRKRAIHALRQGLQAGKVAGLLGKSEWWVYKCQALYRKGGSEALTPHSTRPQHSPRQLPPATRAAIRTARLALEEEATRPHALCYIGASAVRERLRHQGLTPLPSVSAIERELRQAGLTHVRQQAQKTPAVRYPHLQPKQAHTLVQVDIFPRYLAGGTLVNCFHALDVVSHYPTGLQCTSKRAADAGAFLLQVWRELGVPHYTQLDNEGCFSGGFTHPHVLGRVVRLGLWAGTQVVFSPFYHPASNGTVERFHQDYDRNTWQKQRFATLDAVHTASRSFFLAYRQSAHQRALQGATAAAHHARLPTAALPPSLPADPLPLYAGRVHFMRKVTVQGTVRVLNVDWPLADVPPETGVWVTLDLTPQGAALAVFDTPPDADRRRCLATYPFPLKEPVLARPAPPSPAQAPIRSPLLLPSVQRLSAALLHDVLKVFPAVRRLIDSTMS